MLYRIAIENFFSIADRQELVFEVPKNAPESASFRFSPSGEDIRLPSVVGFFGANASGKSTILRAIVSIARFACISFDSTHEINQLFQPYRQKDWWGKPTKMLFEFDGRLQEDAPSAIFRYEIHISHTAEDLANKTISYEALHYAPKGKFRRLFEREEQNFHFGHEFNVSNISERKESIRADASVISTLAKFNHSISTYLIQLLGIFQANMIGVMNIQKNRPHWLISYVNDNLCLEHLNSELKRLDVGLEFMAITHSPLLGTQVQFQHTGLDGPIFFDEESRGTQHFIEIFPLLYYALKKGSIAIIDELDADLHPLLLPEIFRWFGDATRNPHGAQLFFTAHNSALLDDLEKEQVFFTEKHSGKPTQVYGAREIKGLRRGPSLMKKYLMGELGAIPYIG